MAYLLLYGPELIGIIWACKTNNYDRIIIFSPLWLLIGGIIYALYCDVKAQNLKHKGKKDSDEYRKYKQERDMTYLCIGASLWNMGKKTKDTIKDISDVDHWNTKI